MRHRFHRRTGRCAGPIFAPELQIAHRAVPKSVLGWLATLVLIGLVGVFHADSALARSGDAAEWSCLSFVDTFRLWKEGVH